MNINIMTKTNKCSNKTVCYNNHNNACEMKTIENFIALVTSQDQQININNHKPAALDRLPSFVGLAERDNEYSLKTALKPTFQKLKCSVMEYAQSIGFYPHTYDT